MEHEPSGFLGDAKGPMNFPTANAVLAVHGHPYDRKPFVETERRILKESPGFETEFRVIVFSVALPQTRFLQVHNVIGIAPGAPHNAIRPTKFGHELAAIVVILEVDQSFLKSAGRFHDSSMPEHAWSVKYIFTQFNNVTVNPK
jgi:hypothetical protein